MSNSRKVIWISFAVFMFIQVSISYWVSQNSTKVIHYYFVNSQDLTLHLNFMLFFTLFGLVLFLFSFMVYQLDGMKAKKQITQLENDKNELKAKLFDLQEEISKSKEPKTVLATEPKPEPDSKAEKDSSQSKKNSN